MRKNVLIIALCLFAGVANAQIRYGIEIGGVASRGGIMDKSAFGYKIGGVIEIPLNREATTFNFIETGLFYRNRTLNSLESYHKNANFDYISFSLNYLELPIMFFRELRPGRFRAFFGYGFVFNYGLGGNAQLTGIVGNENKFDVETNAPFKNSTVVVGENSFDFQRFNPFDVGVSLKYRTAFSRLYVDVGANVFLLNFNSKYIPRANFLDLGVSVSYRF